jgi:hypothetical protein
MRRIVHMAVAPALGDDRGEQTHTFALFALCDDGTLWVRYGTDGEWESVETPQGDP